jgi:ATP-dependent RNA helicase DHX37/DHR1
MSATLRISDFAENKALFPSAPPVITVSARQHPVTVHFSRRTSSDYVSEAVKKASKIHARLPPGGILIFLTGQSEILGVCRKLEAKFGRKALDEKSPRRLTRGSLSVPAGESARDINIVTSNQGLSRLFGIIIFKIDGITVDVEPEDCELGVSTQEDLAIDVDDDVADDDPEALDSDNEHHIDEELGLDGEETNCTPLHASYPSLNCSCNANLQLLCISYPCSLSCQVTSRCEYSNRHR